MHRARSWPQGFLPKFLSLGRLLGSLDSFRVKIETNDVRVEKGATLVTSR